MKLNSFVLTGSAVCALFASFAFKPAKTAMYKEAAGINYPGIGCLELFATDQDGCHPFNTGAICTVTRSGTPYTAYVRSSEPGFTPCTTVFRQP